MPIQAFEPDPAVRSAAEAQDREKRAANEADWA